MSILIRVEDTTTFEDVSKDKTFIKQKAYVRTIGADGQLSKYPQEISVTLGMVGGKRPIREPYAVGEYLPSLDSFRVRFGRLDMQYMNLQPVKEIFEVVKQERAA